MAKFPGDLINVPFKFRIKFKSCSIEFNCFQVFDVCHLCSKGDLCVLLEHVERKEGGSSSHGE